MAILKGSATIHHPADQKLLGKGRCVLLSRDSPQGGPTTSGTIVITQWYGQPLSLGQLEGDYLLLFEDGRSLVGTFTRHVITENGTGPEVLRFTGRAFLAQREEAAEGSDRG